jgi:lipopolysaccharide/colanic/teichoic acid biosynthesis glycosyltransferase
MSLSKRSSSLDKLVKRLFDILASALGLLFLSPVFGLIALTIKRDSLGPVFYRGRRLGRDGREFHILKFRTMVERPESYQGPKHRTACLYSLALALERSARASVRWLQVPCRLSRWEGALKRADELEKQLGP